MAGYTLKLSIYLRSRRLVAYVLAGTSNKLL
jgi:hypothetical protein